MAAGRRIADRVTTALLCALVLWVPLPFASVRPWSQTVLQVAAFVLCALAVAAMRDPAALRAGAVPAAALAAIGVLGLVQSLPLPAALVRALSARGAELLAAEPGSRAPLSLAPEQSWSAGLAWLAVAALVAAAAILGRARESRRAIGAALVLAALFQVVYGARQWMAGSGTIWGQPAGAEGAAWRLRGTFVNPDHLSLLLELTLAVLFAWGWWSLRRARRTDLPELRIALVAPPVLLWLALFAATAFTGSRGGLLAALAATAVQGLLLGISARRLSVGAAGPAAAAAGLVLVGAIGLQAGFGRWLATSTYGLTWSDRVQTYAATLELWREFPWTGVGLGAFREAFPTVRPAALTGTWSHAHNDWLELLATAGLLGAVLMAVALVWSTRRLVALLVDRTRRSEARAAALAAVGTAAAAAVHSVVDFGLTVPANAVVLAVVVGAALGASTADE